MSLLYTKFDLPGGYGTIITEAMNNRNPGATAIGLVGPSNGGTMLVPQSFFNLEEARSVLGECEAFDLMGTMQGNGAGEIVFVRVGETKFFDEVWMDDPSTPENLSVDMARRHGNVLIFNTGSPNYLYVGNAVQFSEVYIELAAAASFSGTPIAMSIEYWNGSSWATPDSIADTTVLTSKTLQQSGSITFTTPHEWRVYDAPITGGGAGSMYWVRLRPAEQPDVAAPPAVTMLSRRLNALPAFGTIAQDVNITNDVTSVEIVGGGTTGLAITVVDDSPKTFTIVGASYQPIFNVPGLMFQVTGSDEALNNKWFTVVSAAVDTTNTVITVVETVTADPGGNMGKIFQRTVASPTHINDSGGAFLATDIAVGHIVQNIDDGSSAAVLSVANTQIVTTALTGGVLNRFCFNAGVGSLNPTALITAATVVAFTSAGTGLREVTLSGVNVITSHVSVGDHVVKTDTGTPVLTGTVVQITSATKIVIATASTWTPGADTMTILGNSIIYDPLLNFVDYGVRPGTILTYDSGESIVLGLIDYDETLGVCHYLQTDGAHGTTGVIGGYFSAFGVYSIPAQHDTYSIAVPTELVYLESKEWGVIGNNTTFKTSRVGDETRVTISRDSYEELYRLPDSDTSPLVTLVSDITATSQLVIPYLLGGVSDTIPDDISLTYFTGGSNGSAEDADHIEGFEKLLEVDNVGVINSTVYTDAINAAMLQHVGVAASINYQENRIAILAKPEAEDFFRVTTALRDEAQTYAGGGLAEGRTAYVIQRAIISSTVTGTKTASRAAYAAACAGLIAGQPIASPITGLKLNVAGIDKIFSRAERTELVRYGILHSHSDANGISIVKGISTNKNSNYTELSVRRSVDFTEAFVRTNLAAMYVRELQYPDILERVASSTKSLLNYLLGVSSQGSGTVRAWQGVKAENNPGDPTRIDVYYEILPLLPVNVIFTSCKVHSGINF